MHSDANRSLQSQEGHISRIVAPDSAIYLHARQPAERSRVRKSLIFLLVGRQIVADIAAGRVRSVVRYDRRGLNIISCPSCSRVENEAFIELAQQVKEITQYAAEHAITIAVMGCRVNGPGETDDADIGLWCGPHYVNLKRGTQLLGAFPYEDVVPRVVSELEDVIRLRRRFA